MRIAAGTLVVWLLVAVASVAWWPVYRDDAMVTAGVTAVTIGSLVAVIGAVTRLQAGSVAVATVVAFAIAGVPAAVPTEADGLLPTGPGLADLFAGVALGWKRLVTISLPVGGYEALLVPYFVTTLVATVLAVGIATRTRRQELAAVPVLVLFVAGVVVGPTRLGYTVALAVVLAGIALVWALTARHVRRAVAVARTVGAPVGVWRSVLRPALVGTATIAAAGVVAVAVGAALPPTGARTVARSSVVKPFDPRDYVSPLSGFRAYEESPAASDPQLRVTGLPADGFLRVATLDTYDGVVYRVGGSTGASASGTFERVPTSVDVRGVRGSTVHVGVRVQGYSGVWLPTVGDLESVSFSGSDAEQQRGRFFYNRTTGTAAVLGGVRSGTAYDLTAVVPDQPTDSQLATARPGDATVPQPRKVPDAVEDTVRSTAGDADTPGAQLVAVIAALRQRGYVSHGVGDDRTSRSGHGADRIQELLTAPLMIGDQEQYAVAAALMADQIGFPTRVVLGFTAGGDSGADAGGSSARTQTFTGSDVTARIEVDTAQYGWVTIDPNPVVREIPKEQQQTPKPVTRPETVVPPPPADQRDQDQQSPPQSDRKTTPTQPLWLQILLAVLPWVVAVLAFVALLLLPAGVIVLVKRLRRRRRRRAPSPRGRVVGAWDEYRDALLDRGHDVPGSATRREVAVGAPGHGGSGLAALADRAVFGPSDTDDHTADRMWDASTTAIESLRTGRTRWERIRARVSLRSLRIGRVRPGSAVPAAPVEAAAGPGSGPGQVQPVGARYDGGMPNENGRHL